jgi:hypothetical protein
VRNASTSDNGGCAFDTSSIRRSMLPSCRANWPNSATGDTSAAETANRDELFGTLSQQRLSVPNRRNMKGVTDTDSG